MNLFKITLLILVTVFTVASSNDNNQTADLNKSKNIHSLIPISIIVAPSIKNNEYIELEIEIGNPSHKETLVSKGSFKVIDALGNKLNQTFSTFTVPPRKSRIYKSKSLKVKVSKDTKAYIQADFGGRISRSNYFIIHK